MQMSRCSLGSLVIFSLLILPRIGLAQQSVGIVTALKGKAQLTRAATQTGLRFKDDLILRDIIDTQERSLARILFGGKSTVTIRELSRLEVREEILPTGAVRHIHDLSSGAILVNVARRLMRTGDEVQIRTPNAISAVRGSIIFAQYIPALRRSIFILIKGSAIITPAGLSPITLTPLTRVIAEGAPATGVQTSRDTVTQATAQGIVDRSDPGLQSKEEDRDGIAKDQAEQAAQLGDALLVLVAPPPPPPPPPLPPPPTILPGGKDLGSDHPDVEISNTSKTLLGD